jgi:hypothetical protein
MSVHVDKACDTSVHVTCTDMNHMHRIASLEDTVSRTYERHPVQNDPACNVAWRMPHWHALACHVTGRICKKAGQSGMRHATSVRHSGELLVALHLAWRMRRAAARHGHATCHSHGARRTRRPATESRIVPAMRVWDIFGRPNKFEYLIFGYERHLARQIKATGRCNAARPQVSDARRLQGHASLRRRA